MTAARDWTDHQLGNLLRDMHLAGVNTDSLGVGHIRFSSQHAAELAADFPEGPEVDIPALDRDTPVVLDRPDTYCAASSDHARLAGEGPGSSDRPAPPRFRPGSAHYCDECEAFSLWREHQTGDRDGLGAMRGLKNALIGIGIILLFAALTFWAGTKF